MGNEIVVFFGPTQSVRTGFIEPGPEVLFPVHAPVEVSERDGAVAANGFVDTIHRIVDALIHGLDAARHHHLPPQLPGLVDADQPFQLGNQLQGLFLRQKPGGLDRVHQQLQFRQLKIPGGQIVPAAPALAVQNVHALFPQGFQIAVNAFSFGCDAPCFQMGENVLHGQGVVAVAFSLQQVLEHQELSLLLFRFCHGITIPLLRLYHTSIKVQSVHRKIVVNRRSLWYNQ